MVPLMLVCRQVLASRILLADESADPELVARDLLIESEHGPDSSAVLVTPSRALIDAVAALTGEDCGFA